MEGEPVNQLKENFRAEMRGFTTRNHQILDDLSSVFLSESLVLSPNTTVDSAARLSYLLTIVMNGIPKAILPEFGEIYPNSDALQEMCTKQQYTEGVLAYITLRYGHEDMQCLLADLGRVVISSMTDGLMPEDIIPILHENKQLLPFTGLDYQADPNVIYETTD